MSVEKIKQKTVVEQVMKRIKELITSGEYKVHDKIPTESELAEMFGIGRSSIREAIKIFNYLGVLESQTARGTFLCDRANISAEALTWSVLLGENDIDELIEIRAAIELWSLISLTEKHRNNPDNIKDTMDLLEQEITNMQKAISNSSMEDLIQSDYNFHNTVIMSRQNSLFSAIYETLRSFMFEEIKKSYQFVMDQTVTIQGHQKIVDAIKTGDISKVRQTYIDHIEGTKQNIHKVLEGKNT